MAEKSRLRRLLEAERAAALLRDFASLLGPEVSLAVCDESGHLLSTQRPFPPETIQALLKAASTTTECIITPQGAAASIRVEGQQIGAILATGPLPPPTQARAALTALRRALESLAEVTLEKRAIARETLDRYREINLLYNLGETLATCLDKDELPQRALTEASQIIQARQGAILLCDEAGKLVTAVTTGPTEEVEETIAKGAALAEEVVSTGKPQIINDFPNGERQTQFLIAPLLTPERQLGVILLSDKAEGAIFTASDEKLLTALAWQTVIAMENAQLFDNVRRQRDEIAAMKNYMDNIFASIASGVITTDTQDIVTAFNRAAEAILRVPAEQVVNRPYQRSLSFLCDTPLPALIEDVRRHHKTYVAKEISPRLPEGEQIHLNLSLSTLRGSGEEAMGVAIVVDDVTEKRRYERERALVRRYLPSGLVDRLPHDLAELGLRGERRVITILFADIRGFTGFSEIHPPERVMEVLNDYLTLAEAAIRFNRGIVDKYLGDAVMALFNTPLLEEKEHAWRAIQTAWVLKEAVEAYHPYIPPEERLPVSIGICTGEAVVGNVGTEERMEYTAVGDTVNLARRLQESAGPGQILIDHATWELTRDRAQANPLPAMRVRGRQTYTRTYEVTNVFTDR